MPSNRSFRRMMDNLDTYLVSLNQGVTPMQLAKLSFVHNEQMGVHAIDQSPLKKGAKALRLYVYPEEDTCKLHLITFGDKDRQSGDVNECCEYVAELRKKRKRRNEEEQESSSEPEPD